MIPDCMLQQSTQAPWHSVPSQANFRITYFYSGCEALALANTDKVTKPEDLDQRRQMWSDLPPGWRQRSQRRGKCSNEYSDWSGNAPDQFRLKLVLDAWN